MGVTLWRDLDKMSLIEMYLKSGWDILPFRGKQPAVQNVDEWLDRYRSIDRVLDHFDKHPDMNVGMRVRGLTIIDSDCTEIPENFCGADNFFDTLTARTARGHHFYFQHDLVVRTSVKVLDEKTDTRCEGSFVVLPPSIHPSGLKYEWHHLAPVQALPIQVRRVWRENEFRGRGSGTGFLLPHEIPEGMRNETLFRYGRSLRRQGLTAAEIAQELRQANSSRCVPRLSFAEMNRLIKHVWTYSDRR
jgi:putative DNA primase/helicase